MLDLGGGIRWHEPRTRRLMAGQRRGLEANRRLHRRADIEYRFRALVIWASWSHERRLSRRVGGFRNGRFVEPYARRIRRGRDPAAMDLAYDGEDGLGP